MDSTYKAVKNKLVAMCCREGNLQLIIAGVGMYAFYSNWFGIVPLV